MALELYKQVREGVSEEAYARMFTTPNIRPMFWASDGIWLTVSDPHGVVLVDRTGVGYANTKIKVLRIKIDDIDNPDSWKPPTVFHDEVKHGLGMRGK